VFTEITRVREDILQQQVINKEPLTLPEPSGPVVCLSEKLFIPVREHPEVCRVGSTFVVAYCIVLYFDFICDVAVALTRHPSPQNVVRLALKF